MKKLFNKFFGATFLAGTGQESALAYHIHQYADVYTSKPENLLLYPPEAWLHVPFHIKIMPHHVKFPLFAISYEQNVPVETLSGIPVMQLDCDLALQCGAFCDDLQVMSKCCAVVFNL
ncbi:hypothetical protein POTOM_025798 [Populus tomentosa]|uniref:Uncharacterized protein n=1 Tax=Populus tomentosa TaxID=118781 RepID=A0A8X7ZFT8_POPTO|nr:hypothetical protein POTOM_025798 [Populus tomentosa]